VGPRAGLNAGARRKILCPCRESNPDRPARSQTLYCLSYSGSSILLFRIVTGTDIQTDKLMQLDSMVPKKKRGLALYSKRRKIKL
jgi:hypothetical protein